jgi:hypothetical protein
MGVSKFRGVKTSPVFTRSPPSHQFAYPVSKTSCRVGSVGVFCSVCSLVIFGATSPAFFFLQIRTLQMLAGSLQIPYWHLEVARYVPAIQYNQYPGGGMDLF